MACVATPRIAADVALSPGATSGREPRAAVRLRDCCFRLQGGVPSRNCFRRNPTTRSRWGRRTVARSLQCSIKASRDANPAAYRASRFERDQRKAGPTIQGAGSGTPLTVCARKPCPEICPELGKYNLIQPELTSPNRPYLSHLPCKRAVCNQGVEGSSPPAGLCCPQSSVRQEAMRAATQRTTYARRATPAVSR